MTKTIQSDSVLNFGSLITCVVSFVVGGGVVVVVVVCVCVLLIPNMVRP